MDLQRAFLANLALHVYGRWCGNDDLIGAGIQRFEGTAITPACIWRNPGLLATPQWEPELG